MVEQVRAALAPEPQEVPRVPVAFGGPTLAFPPSATGALGPAPPPGPGRQSCCCGGGHNTTLHSTPLGGVRSSGCRRLCSPPAPPARQLTNPGSATAASPAQNSQHFLLLPQRGCRPSACTHGNPWMSRYVLGHCLAGLGGDRVNK